MLLDHPEGRYRFLKGIEPYSSGVVANPGHEIVFVTLARLVAWRDGFRQIGRFLDSKRLPSTALCGIQLRCPTPYSIAGFIAFNEQYCGVLKEWGLYVGDVNPIARTNVAPKLGPPSEQSLYGFAYVRRSAETAGRTFLVAGAGEVRDGLLESERILRRGETTGEALLEKADYVMGVMAERLEGLGGDWDHVNRVNVYTAHPLDALLDRAVLPRLGTAARHGVCCHAARPPIREIEFEMDLRGVRSEQVVDLP